MCCTSFAGVVGEIPLLQGNILYMQMCQELFFCATNLIGIPNRVKL